MGRGGYVLNYWLSFTQFLQLWINLLRSFGYDLITVAEMRAGVPSLRDAN